MDDSLYGQLRILVVDDEKIIVEKYKDILSSFPSFDVTISHQGDDAVRAVQASVAENRPFAVAFLDLGIPSRQDELWTAEHIRKSDPLLEIVIVTAYCTIPLKEIIRRVPPADKLLYLQKPFDAAEIEQFVSALGAKWQKEMQMRKEFDFLKHQLQVQSAELQRVHEELKEENAARRSAEAMSSECKEVFDAFMKYQPAAACIKDRDGRYLYVNQAYKNIFRCESADRIGKKDEDIWPVQVTENLKATDQAVISQGKTLNIVEALTMGDTIQYYLTSKFPIFRQGTPVFIGGISVNLTDKIQETDGNAASEEENRTGFMSLPGLDIGDAMKRLEGSWELYADLLSCFCEDKKDFSVKFRELIEKKKFETALISAHALKGSAATISATALRDAAKSLEDACGAEDEPRIFSALKTVEKALRKVEMSFEELPSVPRPGLGNKGDSEFGDEEISALGDGGDSEFGDEENSGTGDREHSEIQPLGPETAEAAAHLGPSFENLFELLRKFDKCLGESDPAGTGYLQEIEIFFTAARFDAETESLFGKLSEQTYNYSFDSARETLGRLARKIFGG